MLEYFNTPPPIHEIELKYLNEDLQENPMPIASRDSAKETFFNNISDYSKKSFSNLTRGTFQGQKRP
jgi:hypothetical protein